MIEIRKPYERQRHDFNTIGESATKQHFKNECDINNILKKYRKTGLLEHVAKHQGNYEDCTGATDYQTAHNIVLQANATFETLPSNVRKMFGNNAGEFFEFATNPENAEKLVELGLANAPVKPSPAPPVTVEPETPEA